MFYYDSGVDAALVQGYTPSRRVGPIQLYGGYQGVIARSSFLGLSLPSKAVALCTIYSTLMLRPAYSSSNTTPLLLLHNLTDSTARGRWHGRTSASAGAYLAIRSCARAHAYPRLPRESSFRKWTELAWPWHNTSVVSRRELELVVGRLGR